MYDQNSFLQGLAVGKSLKGWSSGIGTSVPTCWNDEGIYTYFYIDYHLPVALISVALFRLSTRVLYTAGEIDITDVESINSTTLKVYCNLSVAKNNWVAAVGYNSSWLKYESGISVPEYSAIFWLDGRIVWTPGYISEEFSLVRGIYYGSETLNSDDLYRPVYQPITISDELTLPTISYTADESCIVTYSTPS